MLPCHFWPLFTVFNLTLHAVWIYKQPHSSGEYAVGYALARQIHDLVYTYLCVNHVVVVRQKVEGTWEAGEGGILLCLSLIV